MRSEEERLEAEDKKPNMVSLADIGEGKGTLLEKGFPFPSPSPSLSPPKTFAWWGGCAEGVRSGGEKAPFWKAWLAFSLAVL